MKRVCVMLCFLLLGSLPVYGGEEGMPITGLEKFELSPSERSVLIKKANSGDAEAAFRLANYYDFLKSDDVETMKWLRKAAELGHPIAQYNLAVIVSQKSDGDSQREAVYWYKRAAESGDIAAMLRMAELYAEGKIVARSDRQARKWYERAALKGDLDAMIKLAGYFSEGQGGAKDNVRAVAWLTLASSRVRSGSLNAHEVSDRRELLVSKMSRLEKKRAEEMFKELSARVPKTAELKN